MDTKKPDTKIDGATTKTTDAAAVGTAKGAEIATNASHAIATGVAKVESAIKAGGERLQETAERAKHVVEQAAAKVKHAAQESAQKAIDGTKELANKAEHRVGVRRTALVPSRSRCKRVLGRLAICEVATPDERRARSRRKA
jgi:hypothetical protein